MKREKNFNYTTKKKKLKISAKKIKQTKDEPTTYGIALLFWYSVQATISINKYFPLCLSQLAAVYNFLMEYFGGEQKWVIARVYRNFLMALANAKIDAIEIQMWNIHIK